MADGREMAEVFRNLMGFRLVFGPGNATLARCMYDPVSSNYNMAKCRFVGTLRSIMGNYLCVTRLDGTRLDQEQ